MAWVDRDVEYPNRIKLTDVDSGETVGTYYLVRDEGEVTEEGTLLNADNLNGITAELAADAVADGLSAFTIDSKNNVKFRNLQSGSKSCARKKGTTKTTKVTFSTAFSSTPKVVVTPVVTAPSATAVGIGSVSTTGFTIYVYSSSSSSACTVNWIAFV